MPRICTTCGHKVIVGQGKWVGVDLFHKNERLCGKAKARSDRAKDSSAPLFAASRRRVQKAGNTEAAG